MTNSSHPDAGTLTDNPADLPVIGILGDGQLAMMMTEAWQGLGGKVHIFAGAADAPACADANHVQLGDASSHNDLVAFFKQVDVVTLESEFFDSQLLVAAAQASSTPLFPQPERYSLIEDKLSENNYFADLGVPIADFFEVKSADDLIDEPGYLKLAKGGYDGIGTYRVANLAEARDVFATIESSGTVLFEYQQHFTQELSMIAARNSREIVFYPLVATWQEHGTCRYVSFPSGVSDDVEQQARDQVGRIMHSLDTRGLFAFEFFLLEDGQLILNESAPRPHNSGHITLDLMNCSQFENHMRAVADLDLREPKTIKPSALMVNLLGTRNGEFNAAAVEAELSDTQSSLLLYGKQQTRVKRKMGHINLWGDDQWERARQIVANTEI